MRCITCNKIKDSYVKFFSYTHIYRHTCTYLDTWLVFKIKILLRVNTYKVLKIFLCVTGMRKSRCKKDK